jgi:hypothetical protein
MADSIAALMVKPGDETVTSAVRGQEAQIVVFSALGLWTLVQAVPRVAQVFLKLVQFATQDMLARTDASGMSAPEIGALLVQVALGVGLMLGARLLAGALKSFPVQTNSINGWKSKVSFAALGRSYSATNN